jgi:tetraacyldisaccharide 4'-kinase
VSLAERLVAAWYAPKLTPLAAALTPLSALFATGVAARRALYRSGGLASQRVAVPVIVVGNITVGGSGKTPLVLAIANELAARGWRPGIVSRGYGRDAQAAPTPLVVTRETPAGIAGDEPAIFARAGWPVAVAADRVAAAHALLAAHPSCNLLIADDGLQHLALARNVEIAVVDGTRGLGNRWRLPAGPLREAPARLSEVDAVVVLGDDRHGIVQSTRDAFTMTLEGDTLHRVNSPQITAPIARFRGERVHALAGIAHPQRFFDALAAQGLQVEAHAFADHHRFRASDLAFSDATTILMTEKDAVKCAAFADDRCWYLPVRARVDPALYRRIEEKLRGPEAA